jgi:peptidylprolyl isomerase
VDATDSRYGFRSKDLRRLGGSEKSRLTELMTTDHGEAEYFIYYTSINFNYQKSHTHTFYLAEWSSKLPSKLRSNVITELPPHGSRIVFELYWDTAPLACKNFATLCTNGGTTSLLTKAKPAPVGESGKPLTYRNSIIHRVTKGFVLQGGDFVFGNGSGGESIYNGKKFKDERGGLALKHDRAGILSMGNSGKNSNTSQFFITLDAAPQCDGKHVVFGSVVSGMEVVRYVESYATSLGTEPSVPVCITDCGAFNPLLTPGGGSWYDRPDIDSYTGSTPEFIVRPRIGILAPTMQVGERFQAALGIHASTYLISVDSTKNNNEIIGSILGLMERFAFDIIVAAPACSKLLVTMDIPSTWQDTLKKNNGTVPSRESVFIEAKPVDAIDAILNDSWIGKLRPGWLLSASFV